MTSTRTEFARTLTNLEKLPFTGNIIKNSGFEIGTSTTSITDWTLDGSANGARRQSGEWYQGYNVAYVGLWGLQLHQYGQTVNGSAIQTLRHTICGSQIQKASLWSLGASDEVVKVVLTYIDDSTDTLTKTITVGYPYEEWDFTSSINTAKYVKTIQLACTVDQYYSLYVDNVAIISRRLSPFAEALRVQQKQ